MKSTWPKLKKRTLAIVLGPVLLSVFLFIVAVLVLSWLAARQTNFAPLGLVRTPRGTWSILARAESAVADRYVLFDIIEPDEVSDVSKHFDIEMLRVHSSRLATEVGVPRERAEHLSLDTVVRIGWPLRFASAWSGIDHMSGEWAHSGIVISQSQAELNLTNAVWRMADMPRFVIPVKFDIARTLAILFLLYLIALASVFALRMAFGRV